jgi:hypothetical protein
LSLVAVALATVALPSPLNPLSNEPPVGGRPIVENEGGIIHRVQTTEQVTARIDERGTPFDVRARQRLVVLTKGDYVFVVPAPVIAVDPGPASESSPGQRTASILWSGFNAGRKVLVADARLRPRAAAKVLPLRVDANGRTVTLSNATPIRASTFTATPQVRPLARYLDAVRAATLRGRLVPVGTATISDEPKPTRASVEAPLHVVGTIGGRRVDIVLGDGRPLRLTVPRGDGRIDLRAGAVPPSRLLTPPGGARSWATATVAGPALLDRAQAVLLRLARVRQYDSYLADPDPRGNAQTTYVYRSGRRPVAAPRAAPAGDNTGGNALVRGLLVALGAAAALAAGAALWARS